MCSFGELIPRREIATEGTMAAEEPKKSEWPELLGKTYEEAEAAVRADNADVKIERVLEASPVTMDFNPERVRIICNCEGMVVMAPNIG